MENTIKIEQIGTELHVAFPFALKDNFKSTFRTAKWNAHSKKWSVTTRSRAKLEAWIAATVESGALISAEDFDAIELTELEYAQLKERAAQLKHTIDTHIKERDSLQLLRDRNADMLEHIEEMKEKVEAAASDVAAERSAYSAEKKSIETIVKTIIDLNVVNESVSRMLREAKNGKTQRGHAIFDEQQRIVQEAVELLGGAGIASSTLSVLADANYNRSAKDFYEWSKPVFFVPHVDEAA